MNNFQKFTSQIRIQIVLMVLLNNLLFIADWWLVSKVFDLTGYWFFASLIIVPLLSVTIIPWIGTRYITQPTKLIWQAILHLAPDTSSVPAPDLKTAHLGKELVMSLVSHVYQLASVAETVSKTAEKDQADINHEFVANSLPLPLMILDKQNVIVFANQATASYLKQTREDIVGQNFYSKVDMAFTNEHTLDAWLQEAKANKAVASQTWERVRLNIAGQADEDPSAQPQFDLAAYYNRDNPNGFETMVVMFDHTNQYAQDDQAMSFVAIAVHELRTPLTLLRGYIEAFQEELGGKVDPELDGFMKKMAVAASQLSSFVNTILNVSRIENNQLELQLHKESWADILQSAISTMQPRAEVRGIHLALEIDPDLPEVGVDRVSITEVLNNLIDNAIKYSGTSDKIMVHAYKTNDGNVETTVKDFGVGIPQSAVPYLFDKFYRNHRNRAQIGGTGLGLYLAKVITTAHGGNIWIRSQEGEGSTFGFTVIPFAQVADSTKTSDNGSADIVRSAHGWIKNHSMYRR
ncbi:MAG: ATP-binding protein [Candidatus Saccharibacteria bacterium]